jgi:hypothetical protein
VLREARQLTACISFSELQRLTHSWRLPRSASSNFTKQIQYDTSEKRRRALLWMNVSILVTFNRHQLCVSATGDKITVTNCDQTMFL